MSRFFIHRPILASVIAVMVMLTGVLSLARLPISRYPDIAPPSIEISATYPGASAKTAEDSVTQILEQSVIGIDGLKEVVSTSDSVGNVLITLLFTNEVNPDTAQIQVQNKLPQVMPLLPQIVQQQGISVSKSSSARQMVIGFVSEDGSLDSGDLDDYVSTNVYDPLSRVTGVGTVELFGSKHAMRIWLDADKLNTYGLTPADISAAVTAQNSQASIGQIGDLPSVPGQQLNASVVALGRLTTPEQFREIVVRSGGPNGSTLRLGDVARVELGQASYSGTARYNGRPVSGLGLTLANGANALEMAEGVKSFLEQLKPQMPRGVKAVIPYDTSPYVRKSIKGVFETLCAAILLVFAVMFLFLQNLRATLIPTIAVPVVLLGTSSVLVAAGLSINMLTMFAVVLAIGLLVDDAIVVVENVERLMREEGLSTVEATTRSMDQISSALVGIACVLSVVFIPMSFLNGSVGVIYRQFSITIVSAMILSVLVALTLTPALCVIMLKPVSKENPHSERSFFVWFNEKFERANHRYVRIVGHVLGRPVRYLIVYAAIASLMGLLFFRLPTAFLPAEDQGFLLALVQGPVGATRERTIKSLEKLEDVFLRQEKQSVKSTFTVAGFSFAGRGQNAGFGFVELKDWKDRKSEQSSVFALQQRANEAFSAIKDAQVFSFAPPPVLELSVSSGFDFYLQDNYGQGHEALTRARDLFLEKAAQSKLLANVRPNGQEDTPQLHLDIDPRMVASHGLSMSDVSDTLSIAWGGRYIDDFLDRGRVKRVIMQADAPFRMAPEDFGRWSVRNSEGKMVSVSSFADLRWEQGPPQLQRYNGVSAMNINGEPAPGTSTGEAMSEIERIVAKLPPGFSVEFTGQSYEERKASSQTPLLYALTIVVVFLCLAGLYESLSIPTAIMLAVPLGVVGAVIITFFRGMERDAYFQVAMLTTVGLTSKNAILIVEFAKQNIERGMSLIDGTLSAVRGRLRPILMTSMAFGFGVLPLAIATGAGAGAQRAIGTGVFGGMIAGTFLGIFFIPLLFVVVQRLFNRFSNGNAA